MPQGIVHDENLQIGLPAEIFFSAENTGFAEDSLPYTSECLTGVCAIGTTRTPKEFKGGNPVSTLKSLTFEEGGTVKITTGALPLEMRQRAMGGGVLTVVAADPAATFTDIQVCLRGTAKVRLPYRNIASLTMTTNDATPLPISESGNYVINKTTGELSRVDGGAVDDGDIVKISGVFSAARKKTWSYGGNTNRFYYACMILFLKDDGSLKRYDIYKMYPKGELTEEYQDDWIKYTMEFILSKDSTRDVDDQIVKIHEETDVT